MKELGMWETKIRVSYNSFKKTAPAAYVALSALGKAVHDSGLDPSLVELVKIRVSQINGCAFCLQHHIKLAREIGVEAAKLDLVATWWDAGIFSIREIAALAWAEELSELNKRKPSDETWQMLRTHFTEIEVVFLTVAIGTINNWNRIGASLRFAPSVARNAAD